MTLLTEKATKSGNLSLQTRQALKILEGLLRPKAFIYWMDLTGSAILGWGGLLYATWSGSIAGTLLGSTLAMIFLYRGGSFIHEVVHFSRQLKGIRTAYNFLFGFALRYPAYIYDPHLYHHAENTFGTEKDPEYLPWTQHPPWKLIAPFWAAALLPVFQIVRFTIAPIILPFLRLKARTWVFRHASTLVVNPAYVRTIRSAEDLRKMNREDLACAAYGITALALVLADILPLRFFGLYYVIFFICSFLNMIRAKVAHRYLNDQDPMSQVEQLLDSTTIPGGMLTEIWAPLGLRYHALHHWIPALPYHSLGTAHHRLVSQLSDTHPYIQTIVPGFWRALIQLIQDCFENGIKKEAGHVAQHE